MRAASVDARLQPVVNLIPNPSFEINTTTWASAWVTDERTPDGQSGAYALTMTKLDVPNTPYLILPQPLTTVGPISLRARVKSPDTIRGELRFSGDSGEISRPGFTAHSDGAWTDLVFSTEIPLGTSIVRVIFFPEASDPGYTFAIDSVMLTRTPQPIPYADGDTPGWRWLGTPHASPSVGYPRLA